MIESGLLVAVLCWDAIGYYRAMLGFPVVGSSILDPQETILESLLANLEPELTKLEPKVTPL